jgi:urease gamma subunit
MEEEVPRATATQAPEDKVLLKTCPDAFVVLRRLTYGQKLRRSEGAMRISMEMRRGKRDTRADIDMMQTASTVFDFSHCIVDHNLEDEDGRQLNMSDPNDVIKLDPRIGEEIASLIDKLNNFEDADEEGNS